MRAVIAALVLGALMPQVPRTDKGVTPKKRGFLSLNPRLQIFVAPPLPIQRRGGFAHPTGAPICCTRGRSGMLSLPSEPELPQLSAMNNRHFPQQIHSILRSIMHSDAAMAVLEYPLTAKATPLLADALACWFDLLRQSEIDLQSSVGCKSVGELLRKYPTLQSFITAGRINGPLVANTIEGLQKSPLQLDSAAQIDRFVVPQVLSGLSHLPGLAQAGNWLSESVAAIIAAEAYWPLIMPTLAPEEITQGPGCHSDPKIARAMLAGRWLASRIGLDAVIQAAAGEMPWSDAVEADALQLGALIARPGAAIVGAQYLAWTMDFAEEEANWLQDAMCALLLRRRVEQGLPRAYLTQPLGGAMIWHLQRCELRPIEKSTSLLAQEADGWLDALQTSVPMPLSACGALTRSGWQQLELVLTDVEALDELVNVLVDLVSQDARPQVVHGDGFSVKPA